MSSRTCSETPVCPPCLRSKSRPVLAHLQAAVAHVWCLLCCERAYAHAHAAAHTCHMCLICFRADSAMIVGMCLSTCSGICHAPALHLLEELARAGARAGSRTPARTQSSHSPPTSAPPGARRPVPRVWGLGFRVLHLLAFPTREPSTTTSRHQHLSARLSRQQTHTSSRPSTQDAPPPHTHPLHPHQH